VRESAVRSKGALTGDGKKRILHVLEVDVPSFGIVDIDGRSVPSVVDDPSQIPNRFHALGLVVVRRVNRLDAHVHRPRLLCFG
jgi:hypothetical protein